MMKIKTAEAIGPALDWLAATCEGYTNLRVNPHPWDNALLMDPPRVKYGPVYLADTAYSTDWAQGGPIIEREKIGTIWIAGEWQAQSYLYDGTSCGETPLIAALRCYVANKLGDEVELPEELR
jgi:hypothetical protein